MSEVGAGNQLQVLFLSCNTFNHGALSGLDFYSPQNVSLLHHHPTAYSAILTQNGFSDDQNL